MEQTTSSAADVKSDNVVVMHVDGVEVVAIVVDSSNHVSFDAPGIRQHGFADIRFFH